MIDKTALIGESAAIRTLRTHIDDAARSTATVSIMGETGVGKDLVARLIHQRGPRSQRQFVAVNCCGVPESLLESELFGHVRGSFTGAFRDTPGLVRRAQHGTLFLDELGDMSLRMQAVLLRFTESGEIQPVGADASSRCSDVRLIVATNRDLAEQVRRGEFRQDLYYRVNVLELRVPPLRDRAEDVPLLLRHFLGEVSRGHRIDPPGVSAEAERILMAYSWPGNVRQLRSIAERLAICASGRAVTPDDLPHDVASAHTMSPSGAVAPTAAQPARAVGSLDPIEVAWLRLDRGEGFWHAIHDPFMHHDLRRADVSALIARASARTQGSYRALLEFLKVRSSEQRRFLAFLSKYGCRIPGAPVAGLSGSVSPPRVLAGTASAARAASPV
jgi:DNA-binding NtrC family response regulator